MDTISVIVPVYKVEPYLRRCLDSLRGQSYEELEVLLVDDGSPDGCPAICDRYAETDRRFRVIHKQNGGLSDARNAGLEQATGDYIAFVDSDDWIEPDMLERLFCAVKRTKADIAVCNYRTVGADGREKAVFGTGEERILAGDEAVALLLEDRTLQNYVWNKLYAAELWKGVRFPEGKAYEDINTTWKLMACARRVVLIPEIGYDYFVRDDSIVQSRSLRNERDYVEQSILRYEALAPRCPERASVMLLHIVRGLVGLWRLMWQQRRTARAGGYQEDAERFARFFREKAENFAPDEPIGITMRVSVRLLRHASPLAYWLSSVMENLYLLRHDEERG